MSFFFPMPKLGHLMEEATVTAWHKKVGDVVIKGEILLAVETDKSVLEVESSVSGKLIKLLVEEGDIVPVHAPLAEFEEI